MSNALKITVQGQDRKTLTNLIKAERRAIEVKETQKITTTAQRRAVSFYEDHLYKLQKKLNPNDSWVSKN